MMGGGGGGRGAGNIYQIPRRNVRYGIYYKESNVCIFWLPVWMFEERYFIVPLSFTVNIVAALFLHLCNLSQLSLNKFKYKELRL